MGRPIKAPVKVADHVGSDELSMTALRGPDAEKLSSHD